MLQLGHFYFSMTHPAGKIETSQRIGQCLLLTAMAVGVGSACRAENVSTFAQPEENPVTATLIAEHTSIEPGGGATLVGVLFDIEEGWHIYGQEPGDAGLPTRVEWMVPDGAVVEHPTSASPYPEDPVRWPKAKEFLDPGDIRTFGYEGTLLLPSRLILVAAFDGDTVPVRAKVSWLACKDVCIPGRADLDLVLPLSPDPPVPSTHAHLFRFTDS